MILKNAPDIIVVLDEGEKLPEIPTRFRTVEIELSSLTFGFANRRIWKFIVFYEPSKNFNCEAPPVSDYKATVRYALRNVRIPEELDPILFTDLEEGEKLQWDLPAPPIYEGKEYIHPDRKRHLAYEEKVAIAGYDIYFNSMPEEIEDYIIKQVGYYESGAWGDINEQCRYDKYRTDGKHWVKDPVDYEPAIKRFDFSQYYSNLLPPCSRPPEKKRKPKWL